MGDVRQLVLDRHWGSAIEMNAMQQRTCETQNMKHIISLFKRDVCSTERLAKGHPCGALLSTESMLNSLLL